MCLFNIMLNLCQWLCLCGLGLRTLKKTYTKPNEMLSKQKEKKKKLQMMKKNNDEVSRKVEHLRKYLKQIKNVLLKSVG